MDSFTCSLHHLLLPEDNLIVPKHVVVVRFVIQRVVCLTDTLLVSLCIKRNWMNYVKKLKTKRYYLGNKNTNFYFYLNFSTTLSHDFRKEWNYTFPCGPSGPVGG